MTRVATTAVAAACIGTIMTTPASAALSQLKAGDTGEAVECIQKALNLYYSAWKVRFSPLTVDGVFGSSTTAKVNEYKSGHGMTANGIVGTGMGDLLRQNAYWAATGGIDVYGYAAAWRTNCRDKIPNTGQY